MRLTATLADSDSSVPDRFTDQDWNWYRLPAATTEVFNAQDELNTGVVEVGDEATYTPVVADKDMFLKAVVTYTDRTRDENNLATDNAASDNFVPFTNAMTSDATTAVRNNPMNQAPKFKEGTSTFRVVEENTKALSAETGDDADDDDALETDNPADNVGGPITATDADSDTPTYTLSGTDAIMFRVRANGQIEVSDKANLNHETNASHTITLTADDGFAASNSATNIRVTIYVTDLDEKPTINDRADASAVGEQSVEYAEDRDDAVLTLTASDPEGVTPIVWSLLQDAGGEQNAGIFTDTAPADGDDDTADDVETPDIADRALFDIDNGVLTFKSSPSFEAESATNDNVYRVVVQASDGGAEEHVNWFKVTVTVTDVEEEGKVTWMGMVDPDGDGAEPNNQDLRQFNADAVLTASDPTDPDGEVANIQWQWYRTSSKTAAVTVNDEIDNADSNTYTVVDSPDQPNDVGKYLRVVATYTDARGNDRKRAEYVSEHPVQATRDDNTLPNFASTDVGRRTTENNKGNIGSPVTATDADGDLLTYSLANGGADNDSFSIDRVTGQLTWDGELGLDFEVPVDVGTGHPDPNQAGEAGDNIYEITIIATDSSGGASSDDGREVVTVLITVTDLNEKPTFGIGDDDPGGIAGMAPDLTERT